MLTLALSSDSIDKKFENSRFKHFLKIFSGTVRAITSGLLENLLLSFVLIRNVLKTKLIDKLLRLDRFFRLPQFFIFLFSLALTKYLFLKDVYCPAYENEIH